MIVVVSMVQVYDDEELFIFLLFFQICWNKRQGDVGYGQIFVGFINIVIMLLGNVNFQLFMCDKMCIEQCIGVYNIVKMFGEGFFGKVKLVVYCSIGQQVVFKIIFCKKFISCDMQGCVECEIEYFQLFCYFYIIKLYGFCIINM